MGRNGLFPVTDRVAAQIRQGTFVPCASLSEALGLDGGKHPRIAAVGAGGKTTTLKTLAAEYAVRGLRPVVITTTHMWYESSPFFIKDPSLNQMLALLDKEGCVFAGSGADRGRMKSLPDELYTQVLEFPVPVLVEADGSRMLPVKFPAAHEPALPHQTDCVLSVYGLQAVGRRIADVSFRPQLLAAFLDKQPEELITPYDIARLAQSPLAGRKNVKHTMEYVVILNQADTRSQRETALAVWDAMDWQRGRRVVVTGYKTS